MDFTIEAESGLDLALSVVEAGAFVLQAAAKRAQAATVRVFFILVYFRLIKMACEGIKGGVGNR